MYLGNVLIEWFTDGQEKLYSMKMNQQHFVEYY